MSHKSSFRLARFAACVANEKDRIRTGRRKRIQWRELWGEHRFACETPDPSKSAKDRAPEKHSSSLRSRHPPAQGELPPRHQRHINQTSKQKNVPPSKAPPQILAPIPSQMTPPVETSARRNQKAELIMPTPGPTSCQPQIRNTTAASRPSRTPCHPCNTPTENCVVSMRSCRSIKSLCSSGPRAKTGDQILGPAEEERVA